MQTKEQAFEKLARSKFRMRFHLGEKELQYIDEKGMDVIRSHAEDFISQKLAPAFPKNDGKQTPMRGHPVFIAQHACACCCRGCLEAVGRHGAKLLRPWQRPFQPLVPRGDRALKWYHVPQGVELTEDQQRRIVDFLMVWIEKERTK